MIRKFIQNEQGIYLAFGSLCLVPLVLMIGLVIDGVNFTRYQRAVQVALDAAVAAGAAVYQSTSNSSQAQTMAANVFKANTANVSGAGSATVTVNTTTSSITATTSVVVPTYIMKLGGVTNATFNLSATAQSQGGTGGAEVAVVIDSSQNNLVWYPNMADMVTGLQNFVSTLQNNILVSITPIHTSVKLDSSKLNMTNFYALLSPSATDETAMSVYYPLNTNNTSKGTEPASVYAFYTDPTTFPVRLNANYSNLRLIWSWGRTYWGVCNGIYCYPFYSYGMKSIQAALPLTSNKTYLSTYLSALGGWPSIWTAATDGLFSSLIVWGWRSIDPGWTNILASNGIGSTTYNYGTYPKAYGSIPKYIILMVHDQNYWDAVQFLNGSSGASSSGYITYTGSTSCSTGSCTWLVTMYGSVPSNSSTWSFYTSACENYYYKTVDQFLGLGSSYVNAANTRASWANSTTYMNNCLYAINSSKFLNICQNIRNAGITIYIISAASSVNNYGCNAVTNSNNAAYFAQCTGSSSRVYAGISGASAFTSTLNTIATAINTAAGTGGGGGGTSTTVISALTA